MSDSVCVVFGVRTSQLFEIPLRYKRKKKRMMSHQRLLLSFLLSLFNTFRIRIVRLSKQCIRMAKSIPVKLFEVAY